MSTTIRVATAGMTTAATQALSGAAVPAREGTLAVAAAMEPPAVAVEGVTEGHWLALSCAAVQQLLSAAAVSAKGLEAAARAPPWKNICCSTAAWEAVRTPAMETEVAAEGSTAEQAEAARRLLEELEPITCRLSVEPPGMPATLAMSERKVLTMSFMLAANCAEVRPGRVKVVT
jgi:hypothetical protein